MVLEVIFSLIIFPGFLNANLGKYGQLPAIALLRTYPLVKRIQIYEKRELAPIWAQ